MEGPDRGSIALFTAKRKTNCDGVHILIIIINNHDNFLLITARKMDNERTQWTEINFKLHFTKLSAPVHSNG